MAKYISPQAYKGPMVRVQSIECRNALVFYKNNFYKNIEAQIKCKILQKNYEELEI